MLHLLFGYRAPVITVVVLTFICAIFLWLKVTRVPMPSGTFEQNDEWPALLRVESEPEPTPTSTWPSV